VDTFDNCGAFENKTGFRGFVLSTIIPEVGRLETDITPLFAKIGAVAVPDKVNPAAGTTPTDTTPVFDISTLPDVADTLIPLFPFVTVRTPVFVNVGFCGFVLFTVIPELFKYGA
jgi:hypothetical protein